MGHEILQFVGGPFKRKKLKKKEKVLDRFYAIDSDQAETPVILKSYLAKKNVLVDCFSPSLSFAP